MNILDNDYFPLMMGRVTLVPPAYKVTLPAHKYSCCTKKDIQITELKREILMLQDLLRNK